MQPNTEVIGPHIHSDPNILKMWTGSQQEHLASTKAYSNFIKGLNALLLKDFFEEAYENFKQGNAGAMVYTLLAKDTQGEWDPTGVFDKEAFDEIYDDLVGSLGTKIADYRDFRLAMAHLIHASLKTGEFVKGNRDAMRKYLIKHPTVAEYLRKHMEVITSETKSLEFFIKEHQLKILPKTKEISTEEITPSPRQVSVGTQTYNLTLSDDFFDPTPEGTEIRRRVLAVLLEKECNGDEKMLSAMLSDYVLSSPRIANAMFRSSSVLNHLTFYDLDKILKTYKNSPSFPNTDGTVQRNYKRAVEKVENYKRDKKEEADRLARSQLTVQAARPVAGTKSNAPSLQQSQGHQDTPRPKNKPVLKPD